MTPSNDASEAPLRARQSDWRLTPSPAAADLEPRLLTREDEARCEHAPVPQRGRRKLRWLFRGVLTLLTLLAVLTGVATIWMRRAMRAALPQIDGTLAVAGLHGPVTVTRDAQGVPSIRATSLDDLFFAQGFVTAQDRLWQMDTLRRHAAGELAEILGAGLVEHDEQQRYLQLRAAADRAISSLPADQLQQIQAYTRGVNAFIDSHRDRLPLEFRLLHYAPRPWTPRDSILVSLVMWQDLSTTFPEKLDRELLSHHLPKNLLADLYPVGSWRDRPPTQPATDLTAPREIEQIPLDNTQSRLAAPGYASPSDLLRVTEALSASACSDCRAGSNNWAVSGVHSASGEPLVSNDMHLDLRVPDIWYEAALHLAATPGGNAPIDVAGFTLPGLPWVLVGRNAHVAWSFTNLGGDVQDVRVEHTRGSGDNLQFEQPDGTWAPMEHHTEHIIVRGGHGISLDVLTVSHAVGAVMVPSPIISPLYPTEHRALSLAWTIYDPSIINAPFFTVDSASDGAAIVASFATFGGPSLNLIYADDQGHIGYHAIGRIPIRGPAVQHPRATQPFVPPPPEPDSDEDSGATNSESPRAYFIQASRPRLLLTATRHRLRRRQPKEQSRSAEISQPASSTTQQLAPQPPANNFTIGSSISPVPVDSLDALQVWSGYVPYNELPAIQDPTSGILATANARITPEDYPYALANDWMDPYRVERIYRKLAAHDGWTPQEMLALEADQHSEFDLALAQRLAYAIDHSSGSARGADTVRLRQAADLLRTWRGQMSAGSPAAAIVAAAHQDLWSALLVPQILAHDSGSRTGAITAAHLYLWGESTTALENIVTNTPARWLPRNAANWNDFLTTVVEQGLHNAHAPRDLAKWQYGTIHRIDIEHPLFADRRIFRWLLGTRTGSGSRPVGGDSTTIDATGIAFGPSERFTADLSNHAATIGNIVTGESGNPASSWYLDQLQPWLDGTSFSLPLEDARAVHTLLLVPGH
ncbi:MAG TPA: penicillin acylase family protein [Candidatus Aquilonibacter sp.]|nr:penicillin acylase family protein [Candidatus Aquilonibacter sp.]